MRKVLSLALGLLFSGVLFAQSDSAVKRSIVTSRGLPKGNDHFLVQLGYLQWADRPDTITTGGIPRSVNVYFMLAFPFRTNPHWSAAVGLGIGSDNMFLKNIDARIKDVDTKMKFNDVSNAERFKKYKLTTDYLELPVELRYSTRPNDDNRSWKFALGAKVGLLLNAKTKGKTRLNANGDTINEYKEKEYSKKFFNSQRLVASARIGYGHFGLFATYQVSQLFKENLGPNVHPFVMGISLSGL